MHAPVTEPQHLEDHELRMALVHGHQLLPLIDRRGLPTEREALRQRLAELDREYLRRFPHAARRWPWPMH